MGIVQMASKTPRQEYSTKKLIDEFKGISSEVEQNIKNLGVERRFLAFTPKGRREEVSEVCFSALNLALKKMGLNEGELSNLIATSDASDYLSPGLSGILVSKLGNPKITHFNLQGMACIAFPKALKLASGMDGYTAIVLSGVNSGWFVNQARHLEDVKGPEEIKKLPKGKQENETRKWLAVIQACLFGDGASAIICGPGGMEIEKSSSITNLKKDDYKSAYFSLRNNHGFKTETIAHLDRLGDLGASYCREAVKSLGTKDAEKWALHTGSKKILDAVAKELGIRKKSAIESYEVLRDYGNLAGASLPFIVERAMDKGAMDCIALGYGWGFASCATKIKR